MSAGTFSDLTSKRVEPRYPIYIPSKGRYEPSVAMTVKALQRDGIPFYVVVEPQEADAYHLLTRDGGKVLILPWSNRGMGSTPARNWCRYHAEADGYARHWQLDDNIFCFYRLWKGRRVPVNAGISLRVCEDFTDRFENVGISGLAYDMFVMPNGNSGMRAPYRKNVHVYSATLISHAMPYRWRLRYNEDTDICLQSLVHGWPTLQIQAFTAKKVTTMTMRGGNTDALYVRDGERRDTIGRFEMARVLEREWPGIVKTGRRYGRWQHSVDWTKFANVPLILRAGVDLLALPEVNEYGLSLKMTRTPKSERVQRLYEEYARDLERSVATDDLWRGLPAFHPTTEPPKLEISFDTPEEREQLVAQLGVTVDKRFADKGWSAWFPPRGRDDPAALRFEP